MLDLNDLRVFAAVVTLNSFSKAADALRIHKSSVSRFVARLESDLGSQLFIHTTRKVRLTEEGSRLYEKCVDILTRVSESIGDVGEIGIREARQLTVVASPELAPMVSRATVAYAAALPGHKVTLRLSSAAEQSRGDIYVAFFAKLDHEIQVVGSDQVMLCASPAYLRERGVPESIEGLSQHSVIGVTESCREATQKLFQDQPLAASTLCADDPAVLYHLVTFGAGIGCVPAHSCADDLACGKLVQLLPDLSLVPLTIGLKFPTGKQLAPAIVRYVEAIKGVLEANAMTVAR